MQSENVGYQIRKCFGKPFKMCNVDHLYNINRAWYIYRVSQEECARLQEGVP
jgi:hypothetical protein